MTQASQASPHALIPRPVMQKAGGGGGGGSLGNEAKAVAYTWREKIHSIILCTKIESGLCLQPCSLREVVLPVSVVVHVDCAHAYIATCIQAALFEPERAPH